jgi:anti-anti-sigma factor
MIVEKRDLTVNGTRVVILRIRGLIKLSESPEFFYAAFEAVAKRNPNIIVDIENVDYIDSTGIGEFVGVCVRLAKKGREIVLLNPPDTTPSYYHGAERVERVIRVAHATDDIRVFTNEEEALAAITVRGNVTGYKGE